MTNAIEQEIVEKFRQLEPDAKERVLNLLGRLADDHPLSALELMRLPAEERQRRVQAAIEAAADEDFETFEAYSEESVSD